MSEYAKNIQTIEDMRKKRIELREEGVGRMSMKQTMCEFVNGMTCKEVAEFMGKIVRCRDCKHYDESDAGCSYFVLAKNKLLHIGNPDGFCAWGERREP